MKNTKWTLPCKPTKKAYEIITNWFPNTGIANPDRIFWSVGIYIYTYIYIYIYINIQLLRIDANHRPPLCQFSALCPAWLHCIVWNECSGTLPWLRLLRSNLRNQFFFFISLHTWLVIFRIWSFFNKRDHYVYHWFWTLTLWGITLASQNLYIIS